MILVGNQRDGGKDLALHLMKQENEVVQLHSMRGFASDNLVSAFQETYAISRGTQCKKYLYSLSLNPPKGENASIKDFEAAIAKIEDRLGLTKQPRAIVFHEKHGSDGELRRHAHAVWSRIDIDTMKAVQLSFDHPKLQEISRDLYIKHDWKMPEGHLNRKLTDKRNFSLVEWQQSKRAGKEPKQIKTIFQDAWAISDSQTSFANALEEEGYILAKGDRGHIAVDYQGEKYAVSKWVGIKAKQVRAKLGEADNLQTIEQAHKQAASIIIDRLSQLKAEQERQAKEKQKQLTKEAEQQRKQHYAQRIQLARYQVQRFKDEDAMRNARLRKGIRGLFDRLTGKRRRTLEQNDIETMRAKERDRREQELHSIKEQNARSAMNQKAGMARKHFGEVANELKSDIQQIQTKAEQSQEQKREAFKAKRRNQNERSKRRRSKARDGPEFSF